MKTSEFLRRLERYGVKVDTSKRGSHLKAYYGERRSTIPFHSKEIGKGLYKKILKQLQIDEKDFIEKT